MGSRIHPSEIIAITDEDLARGQRSRSESSDDDEDLDNEQSWDDFAEDTIAQQTCFSLFEDKIFSSVTETLTYDFSNHGFDLGQTCSRLSTFYSHCYTSDLQVMNSTRLPSTYSPDQLYQKECLHKYSFSNSSIDFIQYRNYPLQISHLSLEKKVSYLRMSTSSLRWKTIHSYVKNLLYCWLFF